MTILDTKQARDVFVKLAQCIGVNKYAIDANVVRLDAVFDVSKLRHRAITISVEPNTHIANPDFYELVIRDVRYPKGTGVVSHLTLGRLSITSSPFNGCNNREAVSLRIQALLKRDGNDLAEWLKMVLHDANIEIINIIDLTE